MELMITEVTEMSSGSYCVAGWDARAASMARPLPSGNNWTTTLIAMHSLRPGATLRFSPIGRPSSGTYPHLTEDVVVDPSKIEPLGMRAIWFGSGAPCVASSVEAGFGVNLKWNSVRAGVRRGAYVPPGARTVSLIGLALEAGSVTLCEDGGKLRACVYDGVASYNFRVVSHALKQSFRTGGLTSAQSALPKSGPIHVRVGLARAWDEQPDACYLMLNGINW